MIKFTSYFKRGVFLSDGIFNRSVYWRGPYYEAQDYQIIQPKQRNGLVAYYTLKFLSEQNFTGEQFRNIVIQNNGHFSTYSHQFTYPVSPYYHFGATRHILQYVESEYGTKSAVLAGYKYSKGITYDQEVWGNHRFVDAKVFQIQQQQKMSPLQAKQESIKKRIIFNPIKSTTKLFRQIDKLSLGSLKKQDSKCLLWEYKGNQKTSFFLQYKQLVYNVAESKYSRINFDMKRYIGNIHLRDYQQLFYLSLDGIKDMGQAMSMIAKQDRNVKEQYLSIQYKICPRSQLFVIEGAQIYYDLLRRIKGNKESMQKMKVDIIQKQFLKIQCENIKTQLQNLIKDQSENEARFTFYSNLLNYLKNKSRYIIFNSPKIENRGLIHDWNKENNANYFDFDYHPNQSVFKYEINASESAFDILIFEVCMVLAKEGWTEIQIQNLKSKILKAMFKDDEFDSVCVEPINIVRQIHLNSAKIIEHSQKSQDSTQLTKLRQLLLAVKQKLKKEAIAQKQAQNPFYKLLQQTPQSEYIDTFYYMNWLRKQSLQLINSNKDNCLQHISFPLLKETTPQKIIQKLGFKFECVECEHQLDKAYKYGRFDKIKKDRYFQINQRNTKRLIFGQAAEKIKEWTDFLNYHSPLKTIILANRQENNKYSTSKIFERIFKRFLASKNSLHIQSRKQAVNCIKIHKLTKVIPPFLNDESISAKDYWNIIKDSLTHSRSLFGLEVGSYLQESYDDNPFSKRFKFFDFVTAKFVGSDKGMYKQIIFADIAVGRINDRLRKIYKTPNKKQGQHEQSISFQSVLVQTQEQKIQRKNLIKQIVSSKMKHLKKIQTQLGQKQKQYNIIVQVFVPFFMIQDLKRESYQLKQSWLQNRPKIFFRNIEDYIFSEMEDSQEMRQTQLSLLLSEITHELKQYSLHFNKYWFIDQIYSYQLRENGSIEEKV